jgi:CheY-like chemotaxis protein
MNHPQPDLGPMPAARPRILLVDDHDVGRTSLARLLDALGYDVTPARDGAEALAALESGPRFDVLLTDVRLPDLDGRELVHVARRAEPRPTIALITGWDVDADECRRLGVDWLFLKPVDVRDLAAKLQQGRA